MAYELTVFVSRNSCFSASCFRLHRFSVQWCCWFPNL